ncbi:MAG: HAMP domain-containing sensor histidine kinase, partial [Rhodothermales bacterium]|nr:HAMP domain-containing sensor histidine kinase [Rhodothermales bacterium]
AHELKNPLNFVNNFAELSTGLVGELREKVGTALGQTDVREDTSIEPIIEELTQNVRRINEHGRRADGIIKSMLDHSRGQPGDRVPTDLNGLLRQYVNLAYHGMRARHTGFNAAFESDYDDAVGMVSVVPQELSRVFVNLLNNALDALQGHKANHPDFDPIVSISTRRAGDLVEIRIQDNGPGIPEEIRYRIFEPFFTTKPMGSGTGLGLSLAYEIVTTGHGGTLTLESDTDSGATFVITLPAPRPSRARS